MAAKKKSSGMYLTDQKVTPSVAQDRAALGKARKAEQSMPQNSKRASKRT